MTRLTIIAASLLVAACNSTPQTTTEVNEPRVYRTGSNLPVRDDVRDKTRTTDTSAVIPGQGPGGSAKGP